VSLNCIHAMMAATAQRKS